MLYVCVGFLLCGLGNGSRCPIPTWRSTFPASASLIQKHEREKIKKRAGLDGTKRGRVATGIDAAGAAMGCVGLAAFAVTVGKLMPRIPTAVTLTLATVTWAMTGVMVRVLRRRALRLNRNR
jgi:hypothetical protein